MNKENLLKEVKKINDPILSWVDTDDNICDAVRYRMATKYGIGDAPSEEENFCFGGEGGDKYGVLIFQDGSLYEYSSGDPSVWRDAGDYADAIRDIDTISDSEKEFLNRYC